MQQNRRGYNRPFLQNKVGSEKEKEGKDLPHCMLCDLCSPPSDRLQPQKVKPISKLVNKNLLHQTSKSNFELDETHCGGSKHNTS
jgi:hypothetical protein